MLWRMYLLFLIPQDSTYDFFQNIFTSYYNLFDIEFLTNYYIVLL